MARFDHLFAKLIYDNFFVALMPVFNQGEKVRRIESGGLPKKIYLVKGLKKVKEGEQCIYSNRLKTIQFFVCNTNAKDYFWNEFNFII